MLGTIILTRVSKPKSKIGVSLGGTLGRDRVHRGRGGPVAPANCRPPRPICVDVAPPDSIQATDLFAGRGRTVEGSRLGGSLVSPVFTHCTGGRATQRHPPTADPRAKTLPTHQMPTPAPSLSDALSGDSMWTGRLDYSTPKKHHDLEFRPMSLIFGLLYPKNTP